MFHTFTAVLSLDFSDDAMVKRGVTKSILKEIYTEVEFLIKHGRKTNDCLRKRADGVTLHSPFSVSVTWCSISSYLASSWDNNEGNMYTFTAGTTISLTITSTDI